MGMDSYVKITSREEHKNYLELLKVKDENYSEFEMFLNEMEKKYSFSTDTSDRSFIEKTFTKEELDKLDGLLKDIHKIYDYSPKIAELKYWRKPYPLHRYIVRNFFNNKSDDNCVRIPLTREGVVKMVDVMKNCLDNFSKMSYDKGDDFYDDDYYGYDDLKSDIEFFTNLMEQFNDDVVIFYYTWY